MAIEAVRNSDYDVVLMDVQMPVVDGVQATKHIRSLPSPKNTVPIIALTAHAMAGAKEEYIAQGMDDYLSKPIDDVAPFSLLNDVAAGLVGREPAPADEPSGERHPLQASAPVIIDPARLEMIAGMMADDKLREFLDVFLAGSSEHIVAIRRVIDEAGFDEIGREAHTLLGMAGNFGALRLSRLATQLKAACDAGDHSLAQRAAGELTEALDATAAALHAWVDQRTRARAA